MDITRYEDEIKNIMQRIEKLKQGLVKENNGANCYGSITTHAQKLEEDFRDLLDKIANEKPSRYDKYSEEIKVLFSEKDELS